MKLENSLPLRLRQQLRAAADAVEIHPPPSNPLDGRTPVYQQLVEAISDARSVRICYNSLAERKVILTRLNPYRLLFSQRSWYVIGRSSLHRSTRTFNLGRILSMDVLEDSYRIPRGFSIDRHLRNAWRMIPEPGPDHEVVVRFTPAGGRQRGRSGLAQDAAGGAATRRLDRVPRHCFRPAGDLLVDSRLWRPGRGSWPRPRCGELVAARALRMAQCYAREAPLRGPFAAAAATGTMTAMFLSIDGGDGTGKSTQLALLGQWLRQQGHQVVACRDPGSTRLGEAVREILLDRHDLDIHRRSEMLLYMAARAQLVEEIIRPRWPQGKIVLCDRYLLANVVYQGYGGGLDVETLGPWAAWPPAGCARS